MALAKLLAPSQLLNSLFSNVLYMLCQQITETVDALKVVLTHYGKVIRSSLAPFAPARVPVLFLAWLTAKYKGEGARHPLPGR